MERALDPGAAGRHGTTRRTGGGSRTSGAAAGTPIWIDLNHDRYPDLFIGNDEPRYDDHTSPNRTYVNVGGTRLPPGEPRGHEPGRFLVRADGRRQRRREGRPAALRRQTHDPVRPAGRPVRRRGRALRRAARAASRTAQRSPTCRATASPTSCWSCCTASRFGSGPPTASFGGPVLSMPMAHGHGLAIGDVDGNGTPDIYAVDGCANRVNRTRSVVAEQRERPRPGRSSAFPPLPPGPARGLWRHRGDGRLRPRRGQGRSWCSTGAATISRWTSNGPDQLLTMGDWQPLR